MLPRSKLAELAMAVQSAAEKDFERIFLSGNLRDTMSVRAAGDGAYELEIPAESYDIGEFRKTGVIVPLNDGTSYASEVDFSGGFSKTHIGYAERAVLDGIGQWAIKNKYRIRIETDGGDGNGEREG